MLLELKVLLVHAFCVSPYGYPTTPYGHIIHVDSTLHAKVNNKPSIP